MTKNIADVTKKVATTVDFNGKKTTYHGYCRLNVDLRFQEAGGYDFISVPTGTEVNYALREIKDEFLKKNFCTRLHLSYYYKGETYIYVEYSNLSIDDAVKEWGMEKYR